MDTSEQIDPGALRIEYRAYIEDLKRKWLAQKRVESRDVLELMSETERSQVRGTIAMWARYVTPLAEAWWKERGYRVEWPDDDSKPMKVFELEGR